MIGVRSTTGEFVKRAREIHGDKYDYSKVNYVNNKTKVRIICPEHGEFYQIPKSHLMGCECPKCRNNYKLSADDFIKKSKLVHGDKYDYSKVEYINNVTKVCIICPEHGEFWQIPLNHMEGHGCPSCAPNKKMDIDGFLKKAKQVHGDKYDYSKVKYVNNNTKVTIICPTHGEFEQTPHDHLSGKGCMECSGHRRKTTEEFIDAAKKVHGDKYDYSKVEYKNSKTKVCIICPKHGEFMQQPYSHLAGIGCPSCSNSKLENEVNDFLIENKIKYVDEKSFTWLNGLRYDFYLANYNIAIECQGEQHFIPIDFAGKGKEWAEKEFISTVERDRLKKKLSDEYGIKVIYYVKNEKYWGKFVNEVHNMHELKEKLLVNR